MTRHELTRLAANLTALADEYADKSIKAQAEGVIGMYGTASLTLYALASALATTLTQPEGAPHDSHPNS